MVMAILSFLFFPLKIKSFLCFVFIKLEENKTKQKENKRREIKWLKNRYEI